MCTKMRKSKLQSISTNFRNNVNLIILNILLISRYLPILNFSYKHLPSRLQLFWLSYLNNIEIFTDDVTTGCVKEFVR